MNESISPLQRLSIDGVAVDVWRQGRGRPLLWLHSVDGVAAGSLFLGALAEHYDVIAPWHPGFGHSDWPAEFRSVDDLAYFYLSFLRELDLREVVLAGHAFGGWLACEIAVRSTQALSQLVLVDALGIKVGDRDARDIGDFYALSQDEMTSLSFHDPSKRNRDYSRLSHAERIAIARSRETFCGLGWKPYMHNPILKRWLRRIDVPTTVLWGESDRIVTADYGRAFADSIPGARFALVPEAGHYPHVEQPLALAAQMRSAVEGAQAPRSVAKPPLSLIA